MPLITWSDELSIGIPKIDTEHQKLVAILNQLDEAMKTGKGTRVMDGILTQLVDYTQFHFSLEEKRMADADYPDLHLHECQHRQLVEKAVKFQQDFVVSRRRITRDMMAFLKYWLTNHIMVDDKAFGKYYVRVAS